MVKHFYQEINGRLSFVLAGELPDLKEKVAAELSGDKEGAKKKVLEQLETAKKELAHLESVSPANKADELEVACKIANYRRGIYAGEEELKRIDELGSSNLVFYELTPVELGE